MVGPPASIEVVPNPASVAVGGTVQLTAVLRNADGIPVTGLVVTWESSATGVATVDGNGLVEGVAEGSAVITATSSGLSGTTDLTVTLTLDPVATVEVTPNPASVAVGGVTQLTATLRDAANNVLTGRAVSWSSSDDNVAPVDATGRVAGLTTGTVTITATSEGKSGTSQVTVVQTSGQPQITTVSPGNGYVSGGTPVTLTGSNLGGVTSVTFGGVAAGNVTVVSTTQVTCVAPTHAAGAVDVVVSTGALSGIKLAGFTYDIASRPVYAASVHTLLFSDSAIGNADYSSATQAGRNGGSYPRMAPRPSPTYGGGAVITGTPGVEIVTPGYNGATGYSFRMKYSGAQFDSPSWGMVQGDLDTDFRPGHTKPQYATFHFRMTYAGGTKRVWNKFFAFSWGGGSRLEVGIWSRQGSRSTDYDGGIIYWNINDNGTFITQQPVGPYPIQDVADHGWYQFTAAYFPPQTAGDNLGVIRVWINDTKIIDCSAGAIGVTPPGGQTTYCTQAELDLLKVASNIEHLWFGASTATSSGDACNYDVSEVRWWRER